MLKHISLRRMLGELRPLPAHGVALMMASIKLCPMRLRLYGENDDDLGCIRASHGRGSVRSELSNSKQLPRAPNRISEEALLVFCDCLQ